MTAREQSAGRTYLLVRGREDLGEHLHRQLFGERCDRQCEERRAAHREDVVECVRRGDRAVVAGVVDNRWKEVQREDERTLVVEAIHRGVVRRCEADEQVLRLGGHETREQLLEARRRILRGAASARCEVCEFDASCFGVQRKPSRG